jgi:enamine deaminase RidA (YjgF/YER057c/UK114 family)
MARISRISSGAPWEPIFGYTRAVKAGGWLMVSGTTAIDESGRIVGRNQMYVQARQAIANISAALDRAGMTLADVVRTRVFVTDMRRFNEVARAHLEAFGEDPPASTVVEVRRLVNPDMLIEIEADAIEASSEAEIEVIEEAIEVEAIPVATGIASRPKRPRSGVPAKSRTAAKTNVAVKPRGVAKAKPARTVKVTKPRKNVKKAPSGSRSKAAGKRR